MRNASLIVLMIMGTHQIASAAGPSSSQKSNQRPLALDSSTTILVDGSEREPVLQAAGDLAGDVEKVFGKKPTIVNRTGDAAAVTILIGERSELVTAG